MRFYGRTEQLKKIGSYSKSLISGQSKILVITGRRRIGKTRLVLEAVKDIPHYWSEQIKEKLGNVFFGELQKLDDLLKFLFDYSKTNPLTVIFDEFQNFFYTDPAAYSVFQRLFDKNKFNSSLLMIFSGSSYSLMEKIFKGSKEPLFGRSAEIITLSYLTLKAQKEFMVEQGIFPQIEALSLFSVFDGIPKYLEDLNSFDDKLFSTRLKKILHHKDWIWEEGENILKEEFGKEYTSYFSILSAISKGRRITNEIEQFTGIKEIGAYLKRLESNYDMIERRLPVTVPERKSKKGRYYLKDNFFSFWFGQIEPQKYLKEIGQKELAVKRIIANITIFSGRKLEKMVIRKIIEENPLKLQFTRIGNYWDRKGTVEIDILIIDDIDKIAYLLEVKRDKKKLTRKVIEKLRLNSTKIPEIKEYKIVTGFAYPENDFLKIELVD